MIKFTKGEKAVSEGLCRTRENIDKQDLKNPFVFVKGLKNKKSTHKVRIQKVV